MLECINYGDENYRPDGLRVPVPATAEQHPPVPVVRESSVPSSRNVYPAHIICKNQKVSGFLKDHVKKFTSIFLPFVLATQAQNKAKNKRREIVLVKGNAGGAKYKRKIEFLVCFRRLLAFWFVWSFPPSLQGQLGFYRKEL